MKIITLVGPTEQKYAVLLNKLMAGYRVALELLLFLPYLTEIVRIVCCFEFSQCFWNTGMQLNEQRLSFVNKMNENLMTNWSPNGSE